MFTCYIFLASSPVWSCTFLSAGKSPAFSCLMCTLEKGFASCDIWLLAEKWQGVSKLLSLNLRESHSYCTAVFHHCTRRVGAGKMKSGSRKGVTTRKKSFFDLKMEMFHKLTARKASLCLFMSSSLIPRILQKCSTFFWRAGNATASHLNLVFTLFCITDVSVDIKEDLRLKHSRSSEITRRCFSASSFSFFLLRCYTTIASAAMWLHALAALQH